MTKQIANILTGCRILGSVLLLFPPVFSVTFYIIYLFCGFSDMIDGTVARKTNSTSELGSCLDTAADIVFVAASMVRLLPAMDIPLWLWIWGGGIATVKIGNIILGYALRCQLVSLHTVMNKVAGLLLFLFPLTISFVEITYTAVAVCAVAALAAIHEGACVMSDGRRKP